jgi:hypothetical protein
MLRGAYAERSTACICGHEYFGPQYPKYSWPQIHAVDLSAYAPRSIRVTPQFVSEYSMETRGIISTNQANMQLLYLH